MHQIFAESKPVFFHTEAKLKWITLSNSDYLYEDN